MAVEDRVDLVGAADRLVHPLRINCHDFLRASPKLIELRELFLGKAAFGGGIQTRLRDCGHHPGNMIAHVAGIHRARVCQIGKQAVEQGDVAIRNDPKVVIRQRARCRFARVDVHDFHFWTRRLGCRYPLVQHRMAPRKVRADEYNEIGLFQIFIGAGHGVSAKGAFVACNGRGHAKP